MIHPHTKLVFINDEIGYGVFATHFLPKGTITYVKDTMEIEVSSAEFRQHSPAMQEQIEKYSYIDERGVRIISWDFAKYVNHCCHCNTMSTGYGFEIAIRDINPGEEITDEYGMFNMEQPMTLSCKYADCRGRVCREDFDALHPVWDAQVRPALEGMYGVLQPLLPFVDEETLTELDDALAGQTDFRSVYRLKHLASNGVLTHAVKG